MFDIGFFEILIIGVVGLFVIGPERLPDTIKTVALWVSRVKRSLLDTRQELEQQIGADEIRREIYNEQVIHNLEKFKDTRNELEERINQWKDDPLQEDNYLDHTPGENDTNEYSMTEDDEREYDEYENHEIDEYENHEVDEYENHEIEDIPNSDESPLESESALHPENHSEQSDDIQPPKQSI